MGGARRLGTALAAAAAVALVAGEAWIPLGHETVRYERVPPGGDATLLDLQGKSVLVGEPSPAWLADAIATGRFDAELEFMTFWPEQHGPARIFAISGGPDGADVMVGQDHMDLVIRVRRPGSDDRGEPEFRVDDVLVQSQPVELGIAIDGRSLVIEVDGRTVVDERVDAGPITASWDRSFQVVVGDEIAGGKGWVGGFVEATVRTSGEPVALVASGALQAGTGIVEYTRPRVFDRPGDWSPVVALLRALLFVPLGYVLGTRLRNRGRAIASGMAIVLVIGAGKWLVPGRHPSLPEVLFASVGVVAGIAVARRRVAGRSGAADVPAIRPDLTPAVVPGTSDPTTAVPAVETDRLRVGNDRGNG